MRPEGRLLVVDDHVEMAHLLADQLADAGYQVDVAHDGATAISRIRNGGLDCVVCDLRMEKVDGLDVVAAAREVDPALPVLIMTAFGGVEEAVEAMKRGAWHYFTKPFRLDEVLLEVERALAQRRLKQENRRLRQLASERSGLSAMVGRSGAMQELYRLVERLAPLSAPVLITGESGSGKELVARALHVEGPRRSRPFVPVNCTALPPQLLESELFGHVRGSFTGATSPRRGLFVEADGGTLFLDEIGDMPAELQAKLLRVIQDGEVRPVGADVPRRVDVRIVAATHQSLEARVRDGRFRADLFYRLNVVPIRVPPLRERREDVPLLIEHFLAMARERNRGVKATSVAPEVVRALTALPFLGNVRELENLIERLVILSDREVIDLEALRKHAPSAVEGSHPLERARQSPVTLRQLENDYIAWVVAQCGGNKTRAAEILGIDVSTIHRREKERNAQG